MNLPPLLKREIHVAVHAQSARFRLWKYLILALLFSGVYLWKGAATTLSLLIALTAAAILIHLLFRWKTHAWTRSWGPYKKITLPNE